MLGSREMTNVAIAAAALGALAFVLYGPVTRKKKRKKGTCVGLTNLGNSCFMNAVLQALAPCQGVHEWLHNVLLKSGHSVPMLAYALHGVWKVLNNRSAEVEGAQEYAPVEVIDALRAHNWHISADEQDAHELFHVITETLDEETERYPPLLSLFDVTLLQDPDVEYQSEKKACNGIGTRLPVLPSRNQHPFRGLLASKLQCTVCGHKNPIRYDTFDSLSLTIPNGAPTMMSLDALLRHYIAPERVHEVECDGCQRRRNIKHKPKTTFVKSLTIGKLPPCLCIHIQRTQWLSNGIPMKTCTPVSYPQCLSMSPYVFTNQLYRQQTRDRMLAGLIGGNISHARASHNVPLTKVRQPYPKLVSELKVLNYTDKYYSPGIGMDANTLCPEHTGYPYAKSTDKGSSEDAAKNTKKSQQSTLNLSQLFRLQKQTYNAMGSYRLMSVVQHYGDVFSGHFVTYRRAANTTGSAPEQWLFTSDTEVRRVSRDEALNAEAYMLFYERIAKIE